MLGKTLESAINDQIRDELYSSYLYQSMSAWASMHNYDGAARWLALQAVEEHEHGMKLYQYLLDRGATVALQALAQPPGQFSSLLAVFEEVQAHEAKVTALIHRLYELSLAEKDYATQVMLHWFITEQVEEEANAAQIVDSLRAVGDHVPGLLQVDRMLAARTHE